MKFSLPMVESQKERRNMSKKDDDPHWHTHTHFFRGLKLSNYSTVYAFIYAYTHVYQYMYDISTLNLADASSFNQLS